MRKFSSKKRSIYTRLKAFSSFSDTFTSIGLKSGWNSLSGLWVSNGSSLTSANSTALISVPVSRTNATVSVNIPSGQTGMGPAFWVSGAGSYWASYANTTISTGPSNCNNGACSGSENYIATRNCSCYDTYGTCQQVYGTCQSTVSDSYGICQSSSTASYGTCQLSTTYGTCSLTTSYGTCVNSPVYGTCSYTPGGTTYVNQGCASAFSGCAPQYNETSCNGPDGMNVCGCPCGQSRVCCYTTVVTSGGYNYPGCTYPGESVPTGQSSFNYAGCSFNGQQVVIGSSWNYGGCSFEGQQVVTGSSWNYGGCSSNGQQVYLGQVTSWNYGGCSSNGQQVYLGQVTSWNYGGCSSNGQQVYLGFNYGGCSSNGQQVVIGQASNCNNGSCSGTENYNATRSCSCSTSTNRIIKTIKSINGTVSDVGSFSVSSTPTTISVVTNGNSVIVSAAGSNATYTNSDGTIYNSFGIIKNDGGTEQGSSVTSFSVTAS